MELGAGSPPCRHSAGGGLEHPQNYVLFSDGVQSTLIDVTSLILQLCDIVFFA